MKSGKYDKSKQDYSHRMCSCLRLMKLIMSYN